MNINRTLRDIGLGKKPNHLSRASWIYRCLRFRYAMWKIHREIMRQCTAAGVECVDKTK